MAFAVQRLVAKKAAAIVFFVALIAVQLRFIVHFHNRDYFWQPQNDPTQNHHRDRYNTTKSASDQREHVHNPEIVVVNEIIHRAFFGLGHRLHRSAAAYHLAQLLSLPQTRVSSTPASDPGNLDQFQHPPVITHFRFHWESCIPPDEIRNSGLVDENEKKQEYNVFRYLFGDDLWKLDHKDGALRASQKSPIATKDNEIDSNSNSYIKPQIRRNMIVLRNDVPGYIAGQLYKDLKLPVNYNSKGAVSQTNESIPLLPTSTNSSNQRHVYDAILDKVMRSDVDFYHRLMDNYKFQYELQEFQIQHKWNERPLVIGLHLRTGNGEDAHFTESGRASSLDIDESIMIARLLRLINMTVIQETKRLWDQKVDSGEQWQDHEEKDVLQPLVFIATDTAHLLPLIEKMIKLGSIKEESNYNGHSKSSWKKTYAPNVTIAERRAVTIEIVTWPQDRLPKNAGVSFDTLKGKGERCLLGWKSAVSDALLLSKVDVLIAAKRSTFTQSLPLTLGFDRNRKDHGFGANDTIVPAARDDTDSNKITPHPINNTRRFSFCEVSEPDVAYMTCYMDARTWLFRGDDDRSDGVDHPKRNERIWSLSIANTTSGAFDQNHTYQQVEHKVTVLLPDVDSPHEFDQAREFLRHENMLVSKPNVGITEIHESIFRYGHSKINKKYRNVHKIVSKTNSSWNFIYDAN